MAAISETLTIASDTSSTGTMTNEESILHITGSFSGQVRVQIAPASTTNWLTIIATDNVMTTPLSTPDSTMQYRIVAELDSGSANVYLGA